jgi:hypothetical protein
MSQPNYPSHRRRSISPQRWVVWRASGKSLRLAGFLHGLRKCPTRLRTPITPLIAYVRFGLHGFFSARIAPQWTRDPDAMAAGGGRERTPDRGRLAPHDQSRTLPMVTIERLQDLDRQRSLYTIPI